MLLKLRFLFRKLLSRASGGGLKEPQLYIIMKKIIKYFVFLIIVLGVGYLTFQFGIEIGEQNILKTPPSNISNPDSDIDFSLFWETWRSLEMNYLEAQDLDYEKMLYGAISGMVDSLDDPYTVFFTPKQAETFEEELSGKYEGVGMVIGIKDDKLKVVSPFKGTPADKAGLKAGDEIVKVEDTLTQDLSIEESVSLIKGPEGTEVKLLIQREGWTEQKEFILKRAVIIIPTLELEIEDNIAAVKMYQFNRILTSEFQKAAIEIIEKGADGIVLDLRNNPGGYLDEAINVAGWFIEKGKIVTFQAEKDEKTPYESRGPALLKDHNVVVLINEGSASGSEILAGALRDQNQVKLIGEKSFGKGSVQEQINLSDGSSLKVTVAKWLTPNGVSIEDDGLTPDIEVEMSEEGDLQLEKAIEFLKSLR